MSRQTIAILGNQYGPYQKVIFKSAFLRLEQEGYKLVFISGGPLKQHRTQGDDKTDLRNHIYSMSRRYDVVGFIIVVSSIGHHADAAQLQSFARDFLHKPLVCFGVIDGSVPSVHVDNYSAMVSVMKHMTRERKRKRFVFIRGWPEGPEASLREQAFRDVLESKGIPVIEEFVINGEYLGSTAYFAMDKLLRNSPDIDAVVAANDVMAQGAVHALAKYGLQVPTDVIVSGFDDVATACTSYPALTSVSYSIDEMVNLAVDQFLLQLNKCEGAIKTTVHVPFELIIRSSSDPTLVASIRNDAESKSDIFDAQCFSQLLVDNLSTIKSPLGISATDVVDDIVSILVNGNLPGNFHLFESLNKLKNNPQDAYWWRHLHLQISEALKYQGNSGLSAEAIGFIASILGKIHLAVWNVESTQQMSAALFHETIYELRSRFNDVTAIADFESALDFTAARFPVAGCFICLYETSGASPDTQASVFYAPEHIRNRCPPHVLFDTCELLPEGCIQDAFNGPIVVEALSTGTQCIGYLVIDCTEEMEPEMLGPSALADLIVGSLLRCLATR
ncbi:MAG: LacI family DNA-binding transcriptional regulator [Granulosicoccus sp.]